MSSKTCGFSGFILDRGDYLMTPTRRDFMTLAAAFGLSEIVSAYFANAQTGTIRVRENIQTFALDQNKINALRLAVKTMKDRSAKRPNDPKGWTYWASSHGTTSTVPSSLQDIYNQCQHSSNGSTAVHFLSWHRAFLFFFEGVLKEAAREAGDTTEFQLPYWDWYAQPVVPRSFTRTTDPFGKPNSLWHSRERTDLSQDTLDRSSFSFNSMLPAAGTRRDRTFSYVFEQDPHGAVHGLIGGDMGFVPRSARDPIFWLHHANIDRLWTAWMKGGSRTLPAPNSPWAQQSWKFDVAGDWTQQAGPLVDSQTSLHYRYDDESMPTVTPAVASAAIAATRPPAKVIAAPAVDVDFHRMQGILPNAPSAPATLSATKESFGLGNSSLAVDMGLTAPSAAQLHGLIAQKPMDLKSATLVLENVELGKTGREGGFSYKIVASLPDASGGLRRAVIGTLNTFSMSLLAHAQGKQDVGKLTLNFPLADILSELKVDSPAALGKGLRVTFEPAQSEEQGGPDDLVKIGAMKIDGSASPQQ
jgi:tyrosinase